MKLLSAVLGVLAMAVMMSISTTTLTGCGDNPLDPNDSASTEDLLPPGTPTLEILSSTQAKIKFAGSNNESSFRGYVLLNANDTIVDSIKLTGVFSRDTFFTVNIDKDVSKTWKIASFNKDGALSATKPPITFNARVTTSALTVNKYAVTGSSFDGLNIDGTVNIVEIPDNLDRSSSSSSAYISTGTTSDFILENRSAGGATLTSMNEAYLIYLPTSTTLLTQAQIDAAILAVDAVKTTDKVAAVAGVAGAYIFYNGKSIRVNGSSSGTPDRPIAGMCFLIVTKVKAIGRVVITSVGATDDNSITFNVYTPGNNAGALLYKK